MKVGGIILGVVGIIGLSCGMYWVAKNISYSIFYEDMVKETIKEMVKKEYLNSM